MTLSSEIDKLETELLQALIIKARTDFYTFVQLMAPTVLPEAFIDGVHISIMCRKLQEVVHSVENPDLLPKRLQIHLPPGSMKSKVASNLFPAWCLGRHPNWCFLAIGSDFEFAVDNFGRPTKDLIDSPQYQSIFPYTVLKRDVQSAGRWDTTKKGRFVAKGAGQGIAGRRAHISIVDDVITEQTSDSDRQKINSWYRKGLRTRLLPRGAEIIINTRWFVEDISGFMMNVDINSPRPWDVVSFPALLDHKASEMLRKEVPATDPRFKENTSFWPELWPTEKLLEIKQTTPPSEWNALYMQSPVSEEGGIIKRTHWQIWDDPKPPKCRYIVVSMDTAFSSKETSDYTAFTVWGVFTHITKTFDNLDIAQDCLIMLSAGKGRFDFAELCTRAQELNNKYTPEFFIVEDKASGQSLIPELRKRSLPIIAYKPEHDKTFRLQATTPYFQSSRIWVPSGKRWAEEVMEEVCSFNPRLKNQRDDYTDTVSQAILWMRDQFKIDNDGYSNRWDEDIIKSRRPKTYWAAAMPAQI
jgi:predicted phage terminase large subunit-like protein